MKMTITPEAAGRLHSIISERASEGQGLRLRSQSGGSGGCGCGANSANSFSMGVDGASEEDAVVEVEGVRLILDPAAAEKLEGAVIDYVEDEMRAGFSIQVAGAGGGACGCGGH
jgi:iron-sulfur cluster assembly protein